MLLYLINEVLWDYTPGIVIIAAENLDQAREIYYREVHDPLGDFDRAISGGKFKVLHLDSRVHTEPGLIDAVSGGG